MEASHFSSHFDRKSKVYVTSHIEHASFDRIPLNPPTRHSTLVHQRTQVSQHTLERRNSTSVEKSFVSRLFVPRTQIKIDRNPCSQKHNRNYFFSFIYKSPGKCESEISTTGSVETRKLRAQRVVSIEVGTGRDQLDAQSVRQKLRHRSQARICAAPAWRFPRLGESKKLTEFRAT